MTSARAFGLTVTGSSAGQELVLCPFHMDTHSSAWWHPGKGLFYCAVCGIGLNGFQLAKRLGVEYEEVVDFSEELEDYDLLDEEDDAIHAIGMYNDYMKKRGVSEKVFDAFNLGYSVIHKAISIPIWKQDKEIVGYQYRFLNGYPSRYKTVGKTQPVWPMPLLKLLKPEDTVLVVEGVFSVLRYCTVSESVPGSATFPPMFALMGAKANQEIVDTLRPFNPVFLYDNDEAGRRACRKMRDLEPLWKSWVVEKSPDDLDDKQMVQFLSKVLERIGRCVTVTIV